MLKVRLVRQKIQKLNTTYFTQGQRLKSGIAKDEKV